jgi:hypothetical protein
VVVYEKADSNEEENDEYEYESYYIDAKNEDKKDGNEN